MLQTRKTEIIVGLFVAIGMATLLMIAIKMSNISNFSNKADYQVIAEFENIGGLKVRSPVTMSGIRIGQVGNISLDSDTYNARVTLNLYTDFDFIPIDTSASIFTSGLLGEQYIELEAGAEKIFLKNGDVLEITQPALVLEQVISHFLLNKYEDRK